MHTSIGWIKQYLFLTVLEAAKSKVKVLVGMVSGEAFFFVHGCLSLCSTLSIWKEKTGLCIRTFVPFMRAPPS
jgi:hypothetical protein